MAKIFQGLLEILAVSHTKKFRFILTHPKRFFSHWPNDKTDYWGKNGGFFGAFLKIPRIILEGKPPELNQGWAGIELKLINKTSPENP